MLDISEDFCKIWQTVLCQHANAVNETSYRARRKTGKQILEKRKKRNKESFLRAPTKAKEKNLISNFPVCGKIAVSFTHGF
jgi:hypothetical protein